jgi:hypothetical protein
MGALAEMRGDRATINKRHADNKRDIHAVYMQALSQRRRDRFNKAMALLKEREENEIT